MQCLIISDSWICEIYMTSVHGQQKVRGFVNLCSGSSDKLQDRTSKSDRDTNHAVTLSGRVSNDIHQLDQNRVVVSKEDRCS